MDTSERAPTEDLLELPPTLENLDAKLNHLIVRTEIGIRQSEAARKAADSARDIALQARSAALYASNQALQSAQSLEPLPKKKRLATIALSAFAGGVLVNLLWQLLTAALTRPS